MHLTSRQDIGAWLVQEESLLPPLEAFSVVSSPFKHVTPEESLFFWEYWQAQHRRQRYLLHHLTAQTLKDQLIHLQQCAQTYEDMIRYYSSFGGVSVEDRAVFLNLALAYDRLRNTFDKGSVDWRYMTRRVIECFEQFIALA